MNPTPSPPLSRSLMYSAVDQKWQILYRYATLLWKCDLLVANDITAEYMVEALSTHYSKGASRALR